MDSNIQVALISAAGLILATTIELIGTIVAARIEAGKAGKKPPSVRQALAGASWARIMLVAILVGLVLLLLGYFLLPALYDDPPFQSGAVVYSFEDEIPPEWEYVWGVEKLWRSRAHPFSGFYSLAIRGEMFPRDDVSKPEGTIEWAWKEPAAQDKVVIFRVYAPQDAPQNLQAQPFLKDKDGDWISGGSTSLPAGKWTTLLWSTKDAPTWEPPAKLLGLEFSLRKDASPGSVNLYEGPLYVDMVEVLTVPDVYAGGPSLDRILQPIVFYDFEGLTQVPSQISLDKRAKSMTLAAEQHLPDGQISLRVDLDLVAHHSDEDVGGILVDLGGMERIDAVSAFILVPETDETTGWSFHAYYVAADKDGNPVYSGSQPLTVGKWTPQFWGTRYAHNDSRLCPDQDQDGQCDAPAEYFWAQWTETEIKALHVSILRGGERYEGPVYIDNLAMYASQP